MVGKNSLSEGPIKSITKKTIITLLKRGTKRDQRKEQEQYPGPTLVPFSRVLEDNDINIGNFIKN